MNVMRDNFNIFEKSMREAKMYSDSIRLYEQEKREGKPVYDSTVCDYNALLNNIHPEYCEKMDSTLVQDSMHMFKKESKEERSLNTTYSTTFDYNAIIKKFDEEREQQKQKEQREMQEMIERERRQREEEERDQLEIFEETGVCVELYKLIDILGWTISNKKIHIYDEQDEEFVYMITVKTKKENTLQIIFYYRCDDTTVSVIRGTNTIMKIHTNGIPDEDIIQNLNACFQCI